LRVVLDVFATGQQHHIADQFQLLRMSASIGRDAACEIPITGGDTGIYENHRAMTPGGLAPGQYINQMPIGGREAISRENNGKLVIN